MHCLNHIAQLGRMAPELERRGFHVLVVGGSNTPAAREAIEAFGSIINIVLDSSRSVYRAFGYGRLVGVLQKSGIAVVESTGVIRYINREANPRRSFQRTELTAVVDALAPHGVPG